MDESGMKVWFNKVWKNRPRPGGNRINKKRTLLVMDSFEGHKTDSIKNIALSDNTDLAFIPSGLLLFKHLMFV